MYKMELIDRKAISVEECAKILGLGRSATYEAVRSGQIPRIKIGGRWLIPLVALERMLEDAARGDEKATG